jgi:hypothetical protein
MILYRVEIPVCHLVNVQSQRKGQAASESAIRQVVRTPNCTLDLVRKCLKDENEWATFCRRARVLGHPDIGNSTPSKSPKILSSG